ncbi:hypothetical protein ABRZ24_04055 [Brenneria populi]|uniref:Uncharacterized protein n=1 Tax=Brenneria populi TaxID=1505588 RepID=A0ABU6JM98_9GAMM|nr:hypothetical protein [Brenneria populi Li et al. 2015]
MAKIEPIRLRMAKKTLILLFTAAKFHHALSQQNILPAFFSVYKEKNILLLLSLNYFTDLSRHILNYSRIVYNAKQEKN